MSPPSSVRRSVAALAALFVSLAVLPSLARGQTSPSNETAADANTRSLDTVDLDLQPGGFADAVGPAVPGIDLRATAQAKEEPVGIGAPSRWAAWGVMGLGVFEFVRRGRYLPGVTWPFATLSYLMPVVIGAGVLEPFFSNRVPSELEGPSTSHMGVSLDLLGFDRFDPGLDGAVDSGGGTERRPAGGVGLGYQLNYQYVHPSWGLVLYGGGGWYQANLETTDWIHLTHFFGKADAGAGVDVARITGSLAGWRWLQAQRANVTVGPSVFHAFLRQADHGTGSSVSPEDKLSTTLPIVTGLGWSVTTHLDFDFNFEFYGGGSALGGVELIYERGFYPATGKQPDSPVTKDVQLRNLGFDELRAGEDFDWDRVEVSLYLPVVEQIPDGRIGLGVEWTRYGNELGASVQQLGVSMALEWKWDG